MNHPTVSCSKCHTPLPSTEFTPPVSHVCRRCGAQLQVYIFPALLRSQSAGVPGDTAVVDGAAGCFYHPHRQALVPCAQCGRFLCSLCEVELHGQHLCLSCVDASHAAGTLASLAHRRTLYDVIALRLALIPTLVLWPTLLTAPLTIWYTLRHWRSPRSVLSRSKIRFIIALAVAGLQMLGWLVWLAITFHWTKI